MMLTLIVPLPLDGEGAGERVAGVWSASPGQGLLPPLPQPLSRQGRGV